ncbi:MAG: ParB/RepB/Spo0J family partition protein [Bdellovibrionales bacterium]|nr:ParB/RepB/Spo0J family partition protein [Bdellovibrionales bacterium]
MSNPNTNTSSSKNKKQKLGRGLGSLLSGDSGAFSKMTAEETEASPEKKPNQKQEDSTDQKSAEKIEELTKKLAEKASAAVPQVPDKSRVWNIPIENIRANKDQPRKHFEKQALEELAASIKEKGIIQPILLKKIGPDKYEIIAGERRWRAAQKAALQEVPAIIRDLDDQEVLELALIENIQRRDLNPIEESEAYDLLMKRFSLTQQELADRVGKDRATVANLLRLLNLAPEVREMILVGQISQGQAKVLLSLEEKKDQMEMALKVKAESLSVRALEKLISQRKKAASQPEKVEQKPKNAAQMATIKEELQKHLGSRVDIEYHSGKGKMKLYFYSDEQLNQLIDLLRG